MTSTAAKPNNLLVKCTALRAAYRVEPVLIDINWTWARGQQWAILGGNGAGKTALANVITDQLRPQRGQCELGADIDPTADILHLSFEMQRRLIEHDIRFDDSEHRSDAFDVGTTVRQVVRQRRDEDAEFFEIARRCHIDHILDRGIRFVSTGESRKTLLARALFNRPKLLILDNPYEGLDRQAQQELQTLINELLQTELAILLLLKQADEVPEGVSHILQLEQGKVINQGDRAEVLARLAQTPVNPQPTTPTLGPLPQPLARSYNADPAQPLLSLRHVEVKYGEEWILRDVNWQMAWGQHCCISGPNGAGKSTLLSMICGDNHRAYGQDISLFGQRRGSGESIWELKERFGIVSTQMQLNHVGRTRVAEVIASGLYDSVGLHQQCNGREREIALGWLRMMGLEHLAKTFYNQLSFGEQRLTMLARALVKSPLILILDEPCIGLDAEHRAMILEIVDRVAERGDCHMLYVSHTAEEMPSCINQHLELAPHSAGGFTAKVS